MHAEIERFAKDVAVNTGMRDELKKVGTEHAAVVRFANSKGYKFSLDDVKALQTSGEISDADLQNVVGGFVLLAGSKSSFIYATGGRILVWF
jgi:predicted ribosomally synthesized peptide with nif11-like leader